MIARPLPLAAAAAICALSSIALAAPSSGTGAPRVAAPAVNAELVQGPDPVDLERLYGRVVVLEFWATWCRPCRQVMPFLEQLHQEHHEQGLSILSISSEPVQPIRSFLARQNVSYTIGRDRGGTLRNYNVRGIPTLVVIGRDGKVKASQSGVDRVRLAELRTLVSELLDEPTPR